MSNSSHQTPLFRFPPDGEKAIMRRCCSSSAQRHGCACSKKLSLTLSFLFAACLPPLCGEAPAALFCFGCTASFFRLCVPLFVRNAVARSFCFFGLHFARKTNIFTFFGIFKGISLFFVEIIIYKCFYIIFFDYGGAHG